MRTKFKKGRGVLWNGVEARRGRDTRRSLRSGGGGRMKTAQSGPWQKIGGMQGGAAERAVKSTRDHSETKISERALA